LKDKIKEWIQAGHLRRFVKREGGRFSSRGEREKHYEERPRRTSEYRDREGDRTRRGAEPKKDDEWDTRERPLRGVINYISGGFAGGGATTSARKKYVRAIQSVNAVTVCSKRHMLPITFRDDDFQANRVFGVTGGKFLGFMLTQRGIEANPDKCQAVVNMRSSSNIKEIQILVGRLTVLSRFMPKLAERIQPMLKLLKKAQKFVWDEACEQSFQSLKEYLSSPPVLQKPSKGKPLLVYLAISTNAVSAAIVQDHAGDQQPVYYISKALHDAELRYQTVEKVILALVITTRRLRPYFQGNEVIVKSDYPIHKVLRQPDLAGRMVGWSVELSEYHLRCEARGPIKGQCLADFVNELTGDPDVREEGWPSNEKRRGRWDCFARTE